ncbi:MAG: hypothetical protein Q9175_007174, partial [Cornicularia normoerica]
MGQKEASDKGDIALYSEAIEKRKYLEQEPKAVRKYLDSVAYNSSADKLKRCLLLHNHMFESLNGLLPKMHGGAGGKAGLQLQRLAPLVLDAAIRHPEETMSPQREREGI